MQTNVTWNPDTHVIFGPNFNPPKISEDWINKPLHSTKPSSPITEQEIINNIRKQLEGSAPVKADSGKTDWSLMPFEAIEEINKVLDFGAKKYAAHNWKKGSGFTYTRLLGSLLRHIFAYMRGEDKDPESGLSHMAHAGCNVVFLLYYEKYKAKYNNDDRVV